MKYESIFLADSRSNRSDIGFQWSNFSKRKYLNQTKKFIYQKAYASGCKRCISECDNKAKCKLLYEIFL